MQSYKIILATAGIILLASILLILNPVFQSIQSGQIIDSSQIETPVFAAQHYSDDENSEIQSDLIEDDYFHAIPTGTGRSNSRLFYNYKDVEAPPVVEEEPEPTPVVSQPRRSSEFTFVGMVTQDGKTAWTFRSATLETAAIFTLGSSWRGWILKEVYDNSFLFEKDGQEYIINR